MARSRVKKHLSNRTFHLYTLLGLTAFFFGIIATIMITKVLAQNNESNQIYACVNNTNGNMRMITSSDTCKNSEKSITWSIKGPPGPAGKDGNAGGSSGMPFFCNSCFFTGLGDRFAEKDFSYAQIIKSDFSNEDIHGVIFKNAFLRSNNFNNTNLAGADFSEMKELTGAGYPQNNTFINANLKNAYFSNSILHEFIFTGADLENANFSGSLLRGTKFNGAKNLSTANFENAIWENAICPDGTNSTSNGGTCLGHL